MKIIYNNIIPVRGFKAINICGLFFVRGKKPPSDTVIRHEKIHTAQMRELLFIGFYLLYIIEWLMKLPRYGSHGAYRAISFEREAYHHQTELYYLDVRRHFSWLRYILNK